MSEALRILVIDDDATRRQALVTLLRGAGDVAEGAPEIAEIDGARWDLCLGHARVAGPDGARALAAVRDRDVAVVVMAADAPVEVVSAAMRGGAYDYLSEPVTAPQLAALRARARERLTQRRRLAGMAEALAARDVLGSLAVGGPSMAAVRRACRRAAESDAPVLIHGEAATGKRRLAGAIHGLSARAGAPLVTVDCATAGAAGLLDPGGAPGFSLRAAQGGTLILARVDALPVALRAPLYRALAAAAGRVRVIATARAVPPRAGRREARGDADLLRYLRSIEVRVPALRERFEDIPRLAEHLLGAGLAANDIAPRVSPEVFTALMHARWEGNLAELAGVLRAAAAAAGRDGRLSLAHLPAAYRDPGPRGSALSEQVDAYEAGVLRQALDFVDGQVGRAAAVLGVPERTLRRRMRHFGIAKETFRRRAREAARSLIAPPFAPLPRVAGE